MMTADRIAELRSLVKSENSISLSSVEMTWLLEIQEQMKMALRSLVETHVAIDPPASGPCHECLAAITILASIDDPNG